MMLNDLAKDYPTITIIVLVCAGLFCIFCSIKNYSWFVGESKMMLKLLGRKGVRIFYFILGVAIIYCAIMAVITGQVKLT